LFNRPERSVNFLNMNLTYDESFEQFAELTKYHAIYPGEQLYEIKTQCQQIFGPESEACDVHYVSVFVILKKSNNIAKF
jgi:hypothetical protein